MNMNRCPCNCNNVYEKFLATTTGESESAHYLEETANSLRKDLSAPVYWGRNQILSELAEIAKECEQPNWDGYGAVPINQKTIIQAADFLWTLPLDLSLPSIGAEPDGYITFEWYKSPNYVLSVSIGSDDYLHFAALLGASKYSGSVPFIDAIPGEIIRYIQKIMH